jgi:hypothetical protein
LKSAYHSSFAGNKVQFVAFEIDRRGCNTPTNKHKYKNNLKWYGEGKEIYDLPLIRDQFCIVNDPDSISNQFACAQSV